MRNWRLAVLLLSAAAATGCFQMATTVTINGDGTGTIEQRQFVTTAGLAQFSQFAALGRGGQRFDPLSEETARAAAPQLGAGVTYVSSTPFAEPGGEGRTSTYAFTDINQLRVALQPPATASMMTVDRGTPAAITCTMTALDNGDAQLRISVPGLPAQGGSALPPLDQLAMFRSMIAGARLSVVFQPAGKVVRANTPYVDGNRVTLLEIDADQLLTDESLANLRAAKSPEELKTVLAHTPGLKAPLDGDVVIEFSRDK